MDACPTQAIRAAGVVDARLCISYQTIENKGMIPRELRAKIGAHIYGCDICLEVCPWNRFAQQSRSMLLKSRFDLAGLSLRDLLSMTQEKFTEVFRRTPIKRTKWTGLLRNACIVAANTNSVDCLDLIVELASHPSFVVRAHAVWAVHRLANYSWARSNCDRSYQVKLTGQSSPNTLGSGTCWTSYVVSPNRAAIFVANAGGGRTGRPWRSMNAWEVCPVARSVSPRTTSYLSVILRVGRSDIVVRIVRVSSYCARAYVLYGYIQDWQKKSVRLELSIGRPCSFSKVVRPISNQGR